MQMMWETKRIALAWIKIENEIAVFRVACKNDLYTYVVKSNRFTYVISGLKHVFPMHSSIVKPEFDVWKWNAASIFQFIYETLHYI